MAIRSVLIAPEAVAGTAAAGTYVFMRVTKWTPQFDPKLDIPRETTGSTITLQRARPGTTIFNFTGQARAYFDLSVHWFAMYHGLPTTVADVGGAIGVKSHTFKPGGVSPLTYTIKWKQTGSGGTIWYQATGCEIKTLKLGISSTMGALIDFTGIGRTMTNISAPTIPGDTTAAYNQPWSMDQQSITTGPLPGTAWLKPKKLDLNLDNGMTADWSIQAQRGPSRIKMGDTTLKAEIQAFLDAHVGSLIEAGLTLSQLFSAINYKVVDSGTTIGTGTPTNPSFTAVLAKPFVESPGQDDTNTDQEEKATLEVGYDSTLGSNASFAFVNELAATVFTGS